MVRVFYEILIMNILHKYKEINKSATHYYCVEVKWYANVVEIVNGQWKITIYSIPDKVNNGKLQQRQTLKATKQSPVNITKCAVFLVRFSFKLSLRGPSNDITGVVNNALRNQRGRQTRGERTTRLLDASQGLSTRSVADGRVTSRGMSAARIRSNPSSPMTLSNWQPPEHYLHRTSYQINLISGE